MLNFLAEMMCRGGGNLWEKISRSIVCVIAQNEESSMHMHSDHTVTDKFCSFVIRPITCQQIFTRLKKHSNYIALHRGFGTAGLLICHWHQSLPDYNVLLGQRTRSRPPARKDDLPAHPRWDATNRNGNQAPAETARLSSMVPGRDVV